MKAEKVFSVLGVAFYAGAFAIAIVGRSKPAATPWQPPKLEETYEETYERMYAKAMEGRRKLQTVNQAIPRIEPFVDQYASYVRESHCFGAACPTCADWVGSPVVYYFPDPPINAKATYQVDVYVHVQGDKNPRGCTLYSSVNYELSEFAYIPVKKVPGFDPLPVGSSSGPPPPLGGPGPLLGPPPISSRSAAGPGGPAIGGAFGGPF